MSALDPALVYTHLGVGPEVTEVTLTPDFWSTIGERTELHTGRLLSVFEMNGDWDVWERHPMGEEIVMALGGSITFHLDAGDTVSSIDLPDGHYAVVPRGVWHTADVAAPCRLLAITWGEGTEHRPRV